MKLAIVKSQKDLLRVIPLLRSSVIEFKISTLGNNYSVEYWHQEIHNPEVYNISSEITYHSLLKKNGKMLPGVIHVKEVDRISGINYKYKFPKVTDILMDSEFPVPLFKLTIAENVDRIYTRKADHFVFDFDSPEIAPSNVLEIYIVSKRFDYNKFVNKWPFIGLLWEVTSIDYVTKGVYLSQHFLNMLKSGETITRLGYAFEDFHFLFRFYEDENIEINKICFYENYDYISMLGTTPVQLIDDRTKKPLSKINPAFYYDLNRQIKGGVSKEENELWNNFFKVSYEHISKLDIKRIGFLVPQI